MIRTEDLAKLMGMALEVQVKGNDVPHVSLDSTSHGMRMIIKIDEEGFCKDKREHDGVYEFPLDEPVSKLTYKECEEHLKMLLERVRGFREEVDE